MPSLAIFGLCACIASEPPAAATPAGVSAPATAPEAPAPAGVLAGPTVNAPAQPAKASIVTRGFDGTLEPLEMEPAAAAVFRLNLDEDTLRAVEVHAAARSKAFSEFVTAHYDQVLAAGSDIQAMRTMEPAARAANSVMTPRCAPPSTTIPPGGIAATNNVRKYTSWPSSVRSRM